MRRIKVTLSDVFTVRAVNGAVLSTLRIESNCCATRPYSDRPGRLYCELGCVRIDHEAVGVHDGHPLAPPSPLPKETSVCLFRGVTSLGILDGW